MDRLFRLPAAVVASPDVALWFAQGGAMRALARPWFDALRACGADVRELMHDGCPTACVEDAAFAYVGAFRAHALVGFFHGAALPDPGGLLQGAGKYMRHVKLRPERLPDPQGLSQLIAASCKDIRIRLAREAD